MRRLFMDCEFTNFALPSLISIGLVSEDETLMFYGVRTDFDLHACSDFVHRVVLPLLQAPVPGSADAAGGTMAGVKLSQALAEWLDAIPGKIEILYEADVDWTLLRWLLKQIPARIQGRMVREEVAWVGIREGQYAHHALHDARCLRCDWLYGDHGSDLP